MSISPLLLSTWSFARTAHEVVLPALEAGGTSLDAVENVCRIIEDDPAIDSVGYGGLLDVEGGLTLDGCVMQSPDRCGSVCAITLNRHPVTAARLVMERSPHVMLAGPGADEFAAAQGMEETPVVAPGSTEKWHAWRRTSGGDGSPVGDRPPPFDRGDGSLFEAAGDGNPVGHDTIGVLAIDASGTLAGACSTSGMPYKYPGRVGDSPIIGHGLYVDPDAGAAAATGSGERIMGLCASFQVVDRMRRGASPGDAVREVLEQFRDRYDLLVSDQVGLIACTPDGLWAAGALRPGFKVVLSRDGGHEVLDPATPILSKEACNRREESE